MKSKTEDFSGKQGDGRGARGVGGREDSLALGQQSLAGPLVLPLETTRVPTAK